VKTAVAAAVAVAMKKEQRLPCPKGQRRLIRSQNPFICKARKRHLINVHGLLEFGLNKRL